MFNQLKFIIKNVFRIIITFFVRLFIIRNKNILIAGLRKPKVPLIKVQNDYFMHNTKYLFLYLNNNPTHNLKLIYLCDDKDMIKELKDKGYKNIYPRKSFKGIYYALRAKYWLYDDSEFSVSTPILAANAVLINLWHGIPLKKIGYDLRKLNPIKEKIRKVLVLNLAYHIANGEYDTLSYKTAFLAFDNKIKILGSPRLDVLFHDFKNQDLFMEADYNNIKKFKDSGKKILIYMPTFRDTGRDISSWLNSDKLKEFLKENNAVLVCKLHFADKNTLTDKAFNQIYKMNSDSDIYPLLKYSDGLITDYSSINFDYLLLDKPIIYYVPDLQEYREKCRDFYIPYEEYAAGTVTKNENELCSAVVDVINGVDNYKEKRKILRDKMFVYQDGKNCERVIDWIKSLNK